jgi:Flp pilus assembly pilin Flp
MFRFIRKAMQDERGAAPLEYALVAGLMFSILANGVAQLAPKVTAGFTNIGTSLTKHAAGT